MKMSKLMLGSALLAVGLTAGAQAQQYLPQQVQYQAAPYQAPPQRPPSWSYDPYTSGLGPCPQKDHKDLRPVVSSCRRRTDSRATGLDSREKPQRAVAMP